MFTFLKIRVIRFDFNFPEKDLKQLEGNCNVSVGIGIPENNPDAPVKCKVEVMFKSRNKDDFYLKVIAICDFNSDTSFSDKNDYLKAIDSECVPIALSKVEELISNSTEQFYGIPITLPLQPND